MRKWLKYLAYFFYLGFNWNFRLAFFIAIREWPGERKYNLLCTTGMDELHDIFNETLQNHASIYQPVNFYTAEKLFNQLATKDFSGAFLDVGCGKGRALGIAAHYGFSKMIGIDLSPKLCQDAYEMTQHLANIYIDKTFEIVCENAANYQIPDEVDTLFLFNPFDKAIMAPFAKIVMESINRRPRKFTILYANPLCKEIWLSLGFKETYHFKKLHYLEGSVLIFTADFQ